MTAITFDHLAPLLAASQAALDALDNGEEFSVRWLVHQGFLRTEGRNRHGEPAEKATAQTYAKAKALHRAVSAMVMEWARAGFVERSAAVGHVPMWRRKLSTEEIVAEAVAKGAA